jgi:DNA (cytosine-5)-methyltransferase 1
VAHTIDQAQGQAIVGRSNVRRLTPRECERLQGFPDDYTLIPYRGKPASDTPRYRALGNSMAVPCMRWIGERIRQQIGPDREQA